MTEYIEREKLVQALTEWQTTITETYGKNDEYVRCLASVLLGIDNIPAADVLPVVRGRWKNAIQSCHDSPHVKCSVCGGYYWEYFKKFKYCPNCGARMEES